MYLKRSIYFLLAIGFLFGVCFVTASYRIDEYATYVAIKKQAWWEAGLQGFGTGICTSIIIILLYDFVIRWDERNDRVAKRNIALNSLNQILKDHFSVVLYGMYKAATPDEKSFVSIEDFFSEEYFKEVQYLDFNKSPLLEKDDAKQDMFEDYSSVPRYYKIIFDANKRMREYILSEVLMVYGQFIETDISEALQDLRFSSFVGFSSELEFYTKTYGQWRPLKPLAINNSIAPNGFSTEVNDKFIETLKEHVEIFQRVVELYNGYALNSKKLDLTKSPDTGTVEWGHCRIEDKIQPGIYSVRQINTETDLQKMILDKVIEIENNLNQMNNQIVNVTNIINKNDK